MSEEEWRAVPGWEGMYDVSDQGNVRSLTRTISKPGWGPFTRKGRILRPDIAKGYLRVTLQNKGAGRADRRLLHHLVLEAFVGPQPDGMEARHLDGIRTNNTPGNLAWGTRVENAADRDRHGNMRRALNRGHCAHGHPFNEHNLGFDAKGRVRCKQCGRERSAENRKNQHD